MRRRSWTFLSCQLMGMLTEMVVVGAGRAVSKEGLLKKAREDVDVVVGVVWECGEEEGCGQDVCRAVW